jgi:branched-chain amino acid transport system permease protein
MLRYKTNWHVQAAAFLALLFLTGLASRVTGIVIPPYYLQICIFTGINIIMALGLNLIAGVTGQLSLGHAAFMSIGAYGSAVASVTLRLPFMLSIIIGGLCAGLIGIIIGFPTLRLRGDYLAIATLGFAEIVRVQFTNMRITGGAIGFMGIRGMTTFPIVMVFTVVTVAAMAWLENSRNGRAMLAVREDEIAAESVGINTTWYKIQAFAVGSFFAGVGGALFAHTTTFIQPSDFGFMKSIEYLNMVVLGGLGSIPGTIVGSIVLTAAPEVLRFMSDYRMLVYGILLVVMMIFRPNGLIGKINFRQAAYRALLLRRPVKRGEKL